MNQGLMRCVALFVVAAGVFLGVALGAPGAGGSPRERVLFEDPFKDKLAEGWSWVYEDRDNWRIEGGRLQIRGTGGSSFMQEHDGKNYLLRTPPEVKEGELCVEAYIENKPTEQWEHAGLLWFYDDDHYVILNKERNNYAKKTSIMFGVEKEGKIDPGSGDLDWEAEGVWLRFRVRGTRIVGECRAAASDAWREVGKGELPVKGAATVGLHAGYSPKKDATRWASFSHFRMMELGKE